MDRDTFSHIRLWCPRPFGTYSQNKPRGGGPGGGSGDSLGKADIMGRMHLDGSGPGDGGEDAVSENMPPDPAPPSNLPTPPSPTSSSPGVHMEDGRVLLDTWYVIKPGNTKEKIAFFVAHQCSGMGLSRPSAVKMKGNWATDCTKAKRRRRCSSYDPPTRTRDPIPESESGPSVPPAPEDELGLSETDLLSVAEMVALVEQRTAMALQGMVAQGPLAFDHAPLHGSASDPTPVVFLMEPDPSRPSSPCALEQQQESRRVAQAVAHFESQQQQQLEGTLLRPGGSQQCGEGEHLSEKVGGGPHRRGEVRIAFRVSSLDPRSHSEPAGRPSCMFMSCGGSGGQTGARAKEKITCDLYQLVNLSSRDPSLLLAASPKADHHGEVPPECPASCSPGSEPPLDLGLSEKKGSARERVTGFHVEVVVTGAVDQCVFYGKDSTENVQEETVCFGVAGGTPSSDVGEDPPPGQLFFLQQPRPEEDASAGGGGLYLSDCGGSNGPVGGAIDKPNSPSAGGDDCSDPSLCRLYRHVSHDFLEIRFQIQRLLEPRQYMLLLPDHIMVHIFSYLPTRALAALKCTCHDFKALIEAYGVRATDSRWNQDPLYRDDPCKQCKRQYVRGDVSLCRWHPKPYHHDLPYGRSYWMCCRRTDKDTPGCRVGLHDNNWVQPCELVHTHVKREEGR